MRVLMLIPSLGGGGAERQVPYMAAGLSKLGVNVHVGVFRGGPNLQPLEEAGAVVHWITSHGNYDPMMIPRVVGLIRRLQPEIVQTCLTQMDVVGGVAACLTGTPWVVTERSAGDHYPRDVRHFLRRLVGRRANGVIANSKGGLTFWTGTRGQKVVVPNALALDQIRAAPQEHVDAGDSKLILYAGRLDVEKNLSNLLEALGVVLGKRDAVAVLAGAGPLELEVRAQIEALGLAGRVRLLGYTDRLWNLMKRADVFVSVSWFEGQPNTVLEAAACGCPLVLSEIAAHRETFDDQSASFASPGDSRAIAAAIVHALDDPVSARQRAQRAQSIVSRFSIDAAAEAFLRVYGDLMAK